MRATDFAVIPLAQYTSLSSIDKDLLFCLLASIMRNKMPCTSVSFPTIKMSYFLFYFLSSCVCCFSVQCYVFLGNTNNRLLSRVSLLSSLLSTDPFALLLPPSIDIFSSFLLL